MPTPKELLYSDARDRIDGIIQSSSVEVRRHLKTLAKERSEITLHLMKEWVSRYSSNIRGFSASFDSKNLQTKLGEAYFQYIQYSFIYRFLNGLDNNTLYNKIFSFEIHFLSKTKTLELTNVSPPQFSNLTDDENLFYISPLGHFLTYKLQKEYHVTPRDLAAVNDKMKLHDFLLDTIRTSLTDFFSQNVNNKVIPLDSFREFLELPNNKNIRAIFLRIEKRPFELI